MIKTGSFRNKIAMAWTGVGMAPAINNGGKKRQARISETTDR
jgi:hypothetical protein